MKKVLDREGLMTTLQLSKLTGAPKSTITLYAKQKRIPSFVVGKTEGYIRSSILLFHKDYMEKYVKELKNK